MTDDPGVPAPQATRGTAMPAVATPVLAGRVIDAIAQRSALDVVVGLAGSLIHDPRAVELVGYPGLWRIRVGKPGWFRRGPVGSALEISAVPGRIKSS